MIFMYNNAPRVPSIKDERAKHRFSISYMKV